MNPPDSLRRRVLAAAAAAPSPTRQQARRTRFALLLVSIALALIIFELAGGLHHGEGRPPLITMLFVGGWSLIAAVLTTLVFGRRRSTLGHHPALMAACAAGAPLVLFLWMCAFYGTYADPFVRVGYRCLALTLMVGATPLAAFLMLRPGAEPRSPMSLGALTGAACGAWAGVVVSLWCPLTHPAHALIGHVAPLTLLIVVGSLAGRSLLGIRRA